MTGHEQGSARRPTLAVVWVLALLAALVPLGRSAGAVGTTVLTAVEDAWVDAGNPTVNHGTTGYLQIDNSPDLHAYLKFSVPVPAGERVTRAVLGLIPNQANSQGLAIRTSADTWAETTVTAANAPAVGSTVYATSGALTAGVEVSLDVTPAVPAAGGSVSFVVANVTPSSYSVKARESKTGTPRLTVTTEAVLTAPAASFTSTPSRGVAPLTVSFRDTSTGAPTSWAWDFGDGATSTEKDPVHVFASPDTYSVRLTATNGVGSGASTGTVVVDPPPPPDAPVASFSSDPTTGTAPLTVAFTDTSTGTPTSWAWDFADGSTSPQQSPTHVFQSPGTYAVTLTAANASGQSTANGTVTVSAAATAPVARFTASPTTGPAPVSVTFTDTSSGSPTAWSWDFGDGSTSTAQNPTNAYRTAGTYVAKLVATNAQGSSSAVTTISVGTGTTNLGYRDQSFTGGPASPTGEKPESKLWFNDGLWWSSMFDSASGSFHVFRLDRSTQVWVDTGTQLDDRPSTKADTLWDGAHLFVSSHVIASSSTASASGNPARLYRFSYDAGSRTYRLDPGFPTRINDYSSETLVITNDSLGQIWATWAQTSKMYAARSDVGGLTWGTPFVLPTSGATAHGDDISSIVSFGGSQVGVMWSNERTDVLYFGLHSDFSAPNSGWTFKVVASGPKSNDDHISLKSLDKDTSGRLYAVVKTSYNEASPVDPNAPLINLLVRDPSSGDWSSQVFGRVSDNHTRAVVLLDSTHQMIYVVATGPSTKGTGSFVGSIYLKQTPMSAISFPPGLGTPIIRDAASANMNNVTSTKQTLTSATGMVLLASNNTTMRYWHADLALP